mgnify:CR=1 FL=1
MSVNNPFFEKSEQKNKHFLIQLFEFIAIFLSLFLFFYLFVFTLNQVDGPSMMPTLKDKDIILVNKLPKLLDNTQIGKSLDLIFKRGDIIVFQNPNVFAEELVKRIVALPKDKVSLRNGQIYVNNIPLQEKYLYRDTITLGADFLEDGGESKVVPDDSFFVLGDNRSKSIDSRNSAIGFIKKDLIKGKVFLRIWPFESFGIVE